MSNYATRYAAICERWPELKISFQMLGTLRWFKGAWRWSEAHVPLHDDVALALVRAKLQDELPWSQFVSRTSDKGDWMVYKRFDDDESDQIEWALNDSCPTALDAMLAWWEGRKG